MSYGHMLYGALWSVLAAVIFVLVIARERRMLVLAACGLTAFLSPLAWNIILRTTETTSMFSHDLPFRPFPVSWQDVGSGVFTLGGSSALLSLAVARSQRAAEVGVLAALTMLGAFLVDIYAY